MSLTVQTEQSKEPKQRPDDEPASDVSPAKWEIWHLRPPHVQRAENKRHAHSREDDLVIQSGTIPTVVHRRVASYVPGKGASCARPAGGNGLWHP